MTDDACGHADVDSDSKEKNTKLKLGDHMDTNNIMSNSDNQVELQEKKDKDTLIGKMNDDTNILWVQQLMAKAKEFSKMDFNNLVEDYPRSVEIASKQREEIKFAKVRIKSKEKQSFNALNDEINDQQTQIRKISSKLANADGAIYNFQRQIDENVNRMIDEAKSFVEMRKQIELIDKYDEYVECVEKYTLDMEMRREQVFQVFESQWIEWDYKEIIFWFKVKLQYFNYNINAKNRYNNDSDNCDGQEQKQNDHTVLLSIDFENVICKNLESEKICGKILSVMTCTDLKNLGFESFEHQCILHNQIKKLVEKYPIPKEN